LNGGAEFFYTTIMLINRLLREFIRKLRHRKKNDFNRVLPLNELITDRWEKAAFLGFGEKTSVYDSSYIFGDVKVGKGTWIGPFTILDGTGGLTIGDNCSISAGVQIYSHDTVKWATSGGKMPYEYSPPHIGNNCYIGPNAIIVKGVTIGNGCIIGANSFVNKSFSDNTRIAGSPAKIIS
jgi:acetyltransferase-like isoleucine patch superfamily enzyme